MLLHTGNMRTTVIGMALAAIFVACAGEAEIEVAGPPAVTGGSGGKADGGIQISTDAAGDVDCVAKTLTPKDVKLPLDLVIYLDGSTSMTDRLAKIQQEFDKSFSTVMVASGVDYQVITIGPAPIVAAPADPARYFFYPRPGTGSSEIPQAFLTTFYAPPAAGKLPLKGWSEWARPDASKALLAITDAGSGPKITAEAFEKQLYVDEQFPGWGTQEARNYRFHFMAGFLPKVADADAGDAGDAGVPELPWLPTDPIAPATCDGAGKYGQDLAILTGGLRLSMCPLDAYSSYFETLAQAEVAHIPIACQFPVPKAEDGSDINQNTIELEVTASGTTTVLDQLHDATECGTGGFYVDSDQIFLCPESCTQVQASSGTSLEVRHGCATGFVPK
jgi:hypothetical protein